MTTLPGKPADQAWRDLQQHLDWTKSKPSLVFLLGQKRIVEDLLTRVELWSTRNSQAIHTFAGDSQEVARQLTRRLPLPA